MLVIFHSIMWMKPCSNHHLTDNITYTNSAILKVLVIWAWNSRIEWINEPCKLWKFCWDLVNDTKLSRHVCWWLRILTRFHQVLVYCNLQNTIVNNKDGALLYLHRFTNQENNDLSYYYHHHQLIILICHFPKFWKLNGASLSCGGITIYFLYIVGVDW